MIYREAIAPGGPTLLATLVCAVLVASGCAPSVTGSPTNGAPSPLGERPSPSPSAPPSPLRSLAPSEPASAAASGWPVDGVGDPTLGPDGTAYTCLRTNGRSEAVTALDPSGRPRPGWPVAMPHCQSVTIASDGALLVPAYGAAGWELHRLMPDGRELPGWPYRGHPTCDSPSIVPTPDSAVVLGCTSSKEGTATIVSLDGAGRILPGWPVTFHDVSGLADGIQVGPDGTVYALLEPTGNVAMPRLWALAPDGSRRAGFPISFAARRGGFRVVPGDRLLLWTYVPPQGEYVSLCEAAVSTIFTELDSRALVVAGWPVTAPGAASAPVVAADGTVYYLTRDHLVARAPDGSVRAGWPVAIPIVLPACEDVGPWLAAGGTIYVRADGLRAFGPDGRAVAGWPYRSPLGPPGYPCVHPDEGIRPAFGPDGRVYVGEAAPGDQSTDLPPTEVVALDQTGRVIPGWPVRVPIPVRGQLDRVDLGGGHLFVTVMTCGSAGDSSTWRAFEPDGSPTS